MVIHIRYRPRREQLALVSIGAVCSAEKVVETHVRVRRGMFTVSEFFGHGWLRHFQRPLWLSGLKHVVDGKPVTYR